MQRPKYLRLLCQSCNRESKMGLVGEMPSEVEGAPSRKAWYRCPKCRQAFLFDLDALEKERDMTTQKIELRDCTEYSPTKTYNLGQAIIHTAWGDVGKVRAKEKTSSGAQAIVVAFEKLGERRLIENLKVEKPEAPPVVEPSVVSNSSNPPQSEVI